MTIGQAIYQVLTTQYKKDAKDAHAAVESAGYTIYKCDGLFHVKNPSTRRDIYVKEVRNGYAFFGNFGTTRVLFDNPDDLKVDLVGYLNKPTKVTDYNPLYRNKAEMLYKDLLTYKWDVEFENREIEDIMRKMKKLQEDLVWHTERRTNANTKLNMFRKKHGLGKRSA